MVTKDSSLGVGSQIFVSSIYHGVTGSSKIHRKKKNVGKVNNNQEKYLREKLSLSMFYLPRSVAIKLVIGYSTGVS